MRMLQLTPTPGQSRKRAAPIRLARAPAFLLAWFLAPAPAAAQGTATYGVLIGQVESHQLHTHTDDSEARTDVVLGAFVGVATPVSWLHIVLEASLARRGTRAAVH